MNDWALHKSSWSRESARICDSHIPCVYQSLLCKSVSTMNDTASAVSSIVNARAGSSLRKNKISDVYDHE